MLKRLSVLIVFLLFSFFPHAIFAAEEFGTSYDVLYDVDESGLTTVTEKITLKNLTSEYFANQFKLTIGATEVSDIKASDPSGPLSVEKEQKDTSTIINVKFNQQVAGLGKTLPWNISFKSKDFAEKAGKVWEIRTPRTSSSSNLEFYNLTLAVPQSFGELSAISPTPKNQTISSGKIFLTFDMNQLKSSGVSATFGVNQVFDFDLTYHLENRRWMPVLTHIALPPDTSYQDVVYQRIDPKPINVTLDNDGNYLAWFRLNRNQKMDVKVFGSAKLYTNSKVKDPVLDEILKKKYIEPQKYWEKDNPLVANKLSEILGDNPPATNSEKAKLIFDFVVNYLKYDSERLKDSIERLGAVTALNNPDSAVCMEFTDLFITLARAAGIPARELDGYAYTSNATLRPLSLTKDILHAWPEYWDDKRGWIMVDPTWQNTTGGVDYFSKLDLNHFVFAIKGFDSSDPIPAGSYKYKGEDSQDVKVALSDKDFLGKGQIDVQIDAPNPILSGLTGSIKLKITNTGNAFYAPAALGVSAGQLEVVSNGNRTSGLIPPFGTAEFDFKVKTKSLLDSFNDQITVSVGEQKFTKDIKIQSFIFYRMAHLFVGGLIGFMIFIYVIVLGGHIYRKKRKSKKTNAS